jgi:hypothetical protein
MVVPVPVRSVFYPITLARRSPEGSGRAIGAVGVERNRGRSGRGREGKLPKPGQIVLNRR